MLSDEEMENGELECSLKLLICFMVPLKICVLSPSCWKGFNDLKDIGLLRLSQICLCFAASSMSL